jgi:HD-GYP domain-containing protein (c-di-GMP phosphodiesterase class II)
MNIRDTFLNFPLNPSQTSPSASPTIAAPEPIRFRDIDLARALHTNPQQTAQQHTHVSNRLFTALEYLNEVGAALSQEKNIDRLLQNILTAARKITNADGGTLYRLVDGKLKFEILLNESLDIWMGGTTGNPVPFYPISLTKEDGTPNKSMVASFVALTGEAVNIPDAYEVQGFDFSGMRQFDQKTGYRSTSFLTIPMQNHEGELIGVLQLLNAKDETGKVVAFTLEDQRLAQSLASQAAIALTNRMLILQLEDLFESLIQLINTAIDEKSPYTGGHCERVPALTMMIADAAAETKEGPLAGFHMSDRDRYELKIAGLLHDCGKITTPVHVVDKATKLETIFDRVQLVSQRFEILKRDAEIEYLRAQQKLIDRAELRAAEEKYHATLRQIEDDRNFIRRANLGSERMSDEDQARVNRIAMRPFRDEHGEMVNFLSEDERENLSIRSGTLTPAERAVINHHITATINMLEALPWPKHLKNVPEFAGGHHERMDGRGYPRGLTREQMSVQARIMGIADIFEALTAKDRPYKAGKTLNESLQILGRFKENGHIDPDLFEVFMREKVYLKYASQFMDAAQIDDVDESQIPGYVP